MSKKWLVILLVIPLLIFLGCPKDEEDEPTPTPTSDNASQAVNSDQEAIVETPGGAAIYVPQGAVPRYENGSAGTMVFSLETDDQVMVTPPSGVTICSRVYRLGPEGFVFGLPVTVEIPILADVDVSNSEVSLYRVNQTTGQAELFAGEYNFADRTVSGQTYHFTPFFLGLNPLDPRGTGCAWITNNSDKWITLCAVPDSLKYPEVDLAWVPAEGFQSAWAPWNHNIGVTNQGAMWLPQGWYQVCVTYYHDPGEHDPPYTHRWLAEQLVVYQRGRGVFSGSHNYSCAQYPVGGNGITDPGIQDGRCDCQPPPTTPVGTGEIQVTLTWYNQNSLDLDLWVSDPGGTEGEWCYYGNGQAPGTTTSGGQLDRDNLCSNYENGRPENIYWTQPPPTGEYIVAVDWYSSCSHDHGNQAFNLRTVVQGVSRTFTGTIAPGTDMQEVTRFQITGSTVIYLPPRDDVDYSNLRRPSKTH